MAQGEVVNYNTENLIVNDRKTFVGNIDAGTYCRGQIMQGSYGAWRAAAAVDANDKLGIFLGSTNADKPKNSIVGFNDSIIVFGEVYADGIVNSDGSPRVLSENDIMELQKSGIFVKRV